MEAAAQTTNEQREQQAQLNHDRAESKKEASVTRGAASSGTQVNIVEFIIVLGAALTADFIEIPIIGWFIDALALGVLWLWRAMKTGFKKDLTFQLLLAFLIEISPFAIIPTWTILVGYIYFQDTKIGKETIGKAQKFTKIKELK